jgi:hypothetical protein
MVPLKPGKAAMTEVSNNDDAPPIAPIAPRPVDFGLSEADLKRWTLRDMLLAEGLASVIMVLVTVLAIWKFWLWGIAIACAGLGVLYLIRRVLNVIVMGRVDRARAKFQEADEAHTKARREYDDAMYDWEDRQAAKEDSGP